MMPRVLVSMTSPMCAPCICIVLRVNHFEIVEAASAALALKAFEDFSFDLRHRDIFLQGTNGFELIRTMREGAPHLPLSPYPE